MASAIGRMMERFAHAEERALGETHRLTEDNVHLTSAAHEALVSFEWLNRIGNGEDG